MTFRHALILLEFVRNIEKQNEVIRPFDTEREYLKTMQTMTQYWRQKGRNEATHTIAKNLMLQGVSSSAIIRATGLEQGRLKELKEELS